MLSSFPLFEFARSFPATRNHRELSVSMFRIIVRANYEGEINIVPGTKR
jgi:hypothetical protein